MITITPELCDISDKLLSRITRVYDGIVIPTTGINYVSVVSPLLNVKLASLYTYGKLLRQNVYNTNFKTMIITSNVKNYNQSYKDVAEHIPDIFNKDKVNIITLDDLLKNNTNIAKKSINVAKKSTLLIVKVTEKNLRNKIQLFKPHVVIIDKMFPEKNISKYFYNTINNIINTNNNNNNNTHGEPRVSYMHENNIAIISFTNNSNYRQIMSENITNNDVIYQYKKCHELVMSNKLNFLVDMIDDKINTDMIISKLATISNQLMYKKIVVIFKNDYEVNETYRNYKATVVDSKNFSAKYHNLLNIIPYNGEISNHINIFGNMYTNVNVDKIIGIKSHYDTVRNIFNNKLDSGILFVKTSDILRLSKLFALENIDCMMILDNDLKKNKILYETLILHLTSNKHYHYTYNNLQNNGKINVMLIEKQTKLLHDQLFQISNIIDDPMLPNIDRVVKILKFDHIRLVNELNSDEKVSLCTKLEKLYGITIKEKKYHNRCNVIYTINIPEDQNDIINQMYYTEHEYLNTNTPLYQLNEEINTIITAKTNAYSGPKWLTVSNNKEIIGNNIGFIRTLNGTNQVEICEILHIQNFERKHKRAEWKEKDNRNRNILFLSSVKKKVSLLKFKKITDYDKIKNNNVKKCTILDSNNKN
jgi:hypothetical protein